MIDVGKGKEGMPLSTDVNLPKDYKPRFPDTCVVCGCPSPVSRVRLITGSIGWWTWLFWWSSKPFSVKAPACTFCGWRLHLTRLIGLLITILIVSVTLWFVWPTLDERVARPFRKWAAMGIALICLIPQFAYEMFFPHPFNITAFKKSVDYEFRDDDLAYDFAELNEEAEWVKIS